MPSDRSRRGAASPIPAETNVAKFPNPLDGQVSFALWPGQNPNLHRLGIYQFEIEATPLDQAMWAAFFQVGSLPPSPLSYRHLN